MAEDYDDLALPDLDELMGSINDDSINSSAHVSNKNHSKENVPSQITSNELYDAYQNNNTNNNNNFDIDDETNHSKGNSTDAFSFEEEENDILFNIDEDEDNSYHNNNNNKNDNKIDTVDNNKDDYFDIDNAFEVDLSKDIDQSHNTGTLSSTINNNTDDDSELFDDEDDAYFDIDLDDDDATNVNENRNIASDIKINDEIVAEDDPNNEDENSNNDAQTIKSKNIKTSNFKNKFAQFKSQALAELKGGEANNTLPEDDESGPDFDENTDDLNEADLIDNNDDGHNESKVPKEKGKSKAKIPNILTKPINLITNLYNKVLNFIIKILETILNFLGRIPIIGKPFKILASKVKCLKIIANLMPLLLILMILIHMHNNAINNHTSITAPDGGAGVITSMSYDENSNSVKAHIKNDGDVILDIVPKFTLYSSKITSPGSWIHPKIESTCTGNRINIDIDAEKDIIVKCNTKPKGIDIKVSGEAENE